MKPISNFKIVAPSRKKVALFLDFDGTLVDIAKTPDQIVLHKKTLTLLAKLNKTLLSRMPNGFFCALCVASKSLNLALK